MELVRADSTELTPPENEGIQHCEFHKAINDKINSLLFHKTSNTFKPWELKLYKLHFMIS